jgi:hypothetical protein
VVVGVATESELVFGRPPSAERACLERLERAYLEHGAVFVFGVPLEETELVSSGRDGSRRRGRRHLVDACAPVGAVNAARFV